MTYRKFRKSEKYATEQENMKSVSKKKSNSWNNSYNWQLVLALPVCNDMKRTWFLALIYHIHVLQIVISS
jgi:hypothetical protein